MPARHRITGTSLPLLLVAAVACGKGGGAAAGDGVAGEVVRAEGTVSATRAAADAQARPLAAGDSVYADDTVTTGDASAVDIRLAHNDALWQLGANTSRRVDASAAWRARKGGGEVAFGQTDVDRTAAAGRHGEREAMETRAEEPEEDLKEMEQDDGRRRRGGRLDVDGEDDIDDLLEGEGGLGLVGGGGDAEKDSDKGGGGGGGGGDGAIGTGTGLGTIGHGGGSGTGSGYGKRSGGGAGSGALRVRIEDLEVDGGLGREVVKRVMRQKYASFKRCYEHELKSDESFSASPQLSFTIAPQGRLSPITVADTPAGNQTFEHCLKAAARAVRMPVADAETHVRFRLVFSR